MKKGYIKVSSLNFDFSPCGPLTFFAKIHSHFTLKPKLFFHDQSIQQIGF